MKQSKFHDELLWRSMPEGANIVRAFFCKTEQLLNEEKYN